jgi:hypothetical protein
MPTKDLTRALLRKSMLGSAYETQEEAIAVERLAGELLEDPTATLSVLRGQAPEGWKERLQEYDPAVVSGALEVLREHLSEKPSPVRDRFVSLWEVLRVSDSLFRKHTTQVGNKVHIPMKKSKEISQAIDIYAWELCKVVRPEDLQSLSAFREQVLEPIQEIANSPSGTFSIVSEYVLGSTEVMSAFFLRTVFLFQGSTVLEVDSDVAISLMLTDVPEEIRKIALPWRTFQLKLPEGLLKDSEGYAVRYLNVFLDHTNTEGVVTWSSSPYWVGSGMKTFTVPSLFEKASGKWLNCVGAFLCGLTFMLEQDPNLFYQKAPERSKGRAPRKTKKQAKLPELPPPQIWYANPQGIWGDDLTANREYLEAKLSGKKYRKDRWIRRGTWRHQRYGKDLTKVKRIHIAPQWMRRNPELLKDKK